MWYDLIEIMSVIEIILWKLQIIEIIFTTLTFTFMWFTRYFTIGKCIIRLMLPN